MGMNHRELKLEDNFTQVPHQILEALARTHLKPNESKIIFLVMRKTYGWHKQSDWISLGQIEEYTGITRSNVCRYIKSLEDRDILVKDSLNCLRLSEDTARWVYGGSSISTIGYYQY